MGKRKEIEMDKYTLCTEDFSLDNQELLLGETLFHNANGYLCLLYTSRACRLTPAMQTFSLPGLNIEWYPIIHCSR